MGDHLFMGKSPEFLKIFLSEKTLFRGSLSQFKVVWVGKRGIPEDPKVGVIRGISRGVDRSEGCYKSSIN